MANLLIFGLGYTASRLADRLRSKGWRVDATGSAGNIDFADKGAVTKALGNASHVLSSIPPDGQSGRDPVLDCYGDMLDEKWLGYLSSTGVYGDAEGAWVDENSPTGTGRRGARSKADAAWLARGARVFRLPGIYGPGRNVFDRLRSGKARRIAMPGQIFSRVHVDDIVGGVIAAIANDAPAGAYNLADDWPCSQNRLIEHACAMSGLPLPKLERLDEADLSPMARGFYEENRRVANGKAKRVLGWKLQYPTYRGGLSSVL